MEECPQCGNKLENPATRLVQDSCGHNKCRACLLEDEVKCKQCIETDLNSIKPSVINCHTPVITFQSQDQKLNVNIKQIKPEPTVLKNEKNNTNHKPDDGAQKRSYQSLFIPNYITINDNPPIYKCELCNKTFNTKWHIKYHQYCNGGIKPLKCDTCSKEFISKTHLEAHIAIHTGTKEYACNICKKSFAEKSKLTRHKILHADDKPFVCQECGKSFKTKESLRLHLRIHNGDKPFKCNQCDAKFNNSSNLKKHVATHSKEKLHMCDQCGKRFKLKWALTVHRKIHSHLRPHKCANCSKAFVNAKDLHRHELIHSDVKAYNCGVCGLGFRRKDNLERHMKNTHPGKKVAPVVNSKSREETQDKPQQKFVDNPNAIKVITAPPSSTNLIKIPETKTPVMNAPLKLAFKTSAFKNYYNIHRDYVPPNDDTKQINVYQKILQPPSPPKTNEENEDHSIDISNKIFNEYKNKPISYETSFVQTSHAVIKNIKFKLPAKYTNIRATGQYTDLAPLKPVLNVNVENELQNNSNEFIELQPAKTSVIVNSSTSELHWRRRTAQNLNIHSKTSENEFS